MIIGNKLAFTSDSLFEQTDGYFLVFVPLPPVSVASIYATILSS